MNAASALTFGNEVTLTETTHIKARILRNGQWSALTEATFMPAVVAGDYDRNGIVDNLDYQVWRSDFGSTAKSAADGNGDGEVSAADYVVWRKAFSAVSARFATRGSVEATASGSTTLQTAPSQSVQLGAPNEAVEPQGADAELFTPRSSLTASSRPAAQPSFSAAVALAASHFDDGLLAWCAQLDAKQKVADSPESGMSESKRTSGTDDVYNNCVDELIALFETVS